MSVRKPLIGLSIFLVLALVVSWMVMVTLRREIGGSTNAFSAMFTDVSGMRPGDDVRVAGVRVGRVDAIELQGTTAKVNFRVEKSQPLFTSTVAAVTYQNIIGQRYLQLTPGPANAERRLLPSGSTIPLDRTIPSFDIATLLNGFEPLFTTLDPKQVDNITNAVVQAFQGDSGSVLALISQTSSLAENVAGPDEVLSKTISDLSSVTARLASQSKDVEKLLKQTGGVLRDLGNRRDRLVAQVGTIGTVINKVAEITETTFPQVQELIERQPGVLAHTVAYPDRVAYTAFNVPQVLKGIARTSEYGSYGNQYICDVNADIFAFLGRLIPAVVKNLTPGNVIRYSPMCR